MGHQYTRRTYDEAQELAQELFREQVKDHFSTEEIADLKARGTVSGGVGGFDNWEEHLGFTPDRRLHYDYTVFIPAEERPHFERIYAQILVSRDRSKGVVSVRWKPENPPSQNSND
ncbi:DUF440 family protein [Roseibacillus persicicus]|uniref:DUF440 family protein n=1 Tax=Roseibacillus persicicus TaxID=454148 RepID=UPI0028108043|nr:DUF440 family protein [Roseibacillus persicicus]MDQ8192682.1 DUF440 family protein [Roseibacillus persicicus]